MGIMKEKKLKTCRILNKHDSKIFRKVYEKLHFINSLRIILLSAVLLSVIILPERVYAKEYFLEDWQCYVDMPQGLDPLGMTKTKATFGNKKENVFFQVKVYSADTYKTADEIFKSIKKQLKAEGTGYAYKYNGNDTVFADISFNTELASYRAYSVFINSAEYDFAVLSFCEKEIYDDAHFYILSALDSFSNSVPALYSPGPVSSFYEYSAEKSSPVKISLPFGNAKYVFDAESSAIEAAEITAEREARVLSLFTPNDTDAWSRFYRMIYRDNYYRTDELFYQVRDNLLKGTKDPVEISKKLLAWLQKFPYSRTGTIADFSPPLTALKDYSADCDSLGLLYIILLKRLGIDAVLMVSSVYSHSMAAVDVPGSGARFPFKGKKYLVAEMTKDVALGQINAKMADPSKWLWIEFK